MDHGTKTELRVVRWLQYWFIAAEVPYGSQWLEPTCVLPDPRTPRHQWTPVAEDDVSAARVCLWQLPREQRHDSVGLAAG